MNRLQAARQEFDRAIADIASDQRKVLVLALVPLVVTILPLVYVVSLLHSANQKLDDLEEKTALMHTQMEEVQHELRIALVQRRFVRSIGYRDVKAMRRRHPQEAEMLHRILELRDLDVGWQAGGISPRDGFDAPSFTAYILREFDQLMGYMDLGDDMQSGHRALFENLRYVSEPEVGDLIFYPADLVFFYFADHRGHPFIIGMTPSGIRALDAEFATAIGYRNFRFAGSSGRAGAAEASASSR